MPEPSNHEPDAGAEDARRRTRRWLVGVFLGIVVLLTGLGVWGLVAGSRHREPGDHLSVSALIGFLAAFVAMLTAIWVVLWQLLNRSEYQRLRQYHSRRRMRVAKALRRGEPINPDDRAVADAVVAVMRKQRLIFWFQPVLVASWIAMAFSRHGTGRWLYAGLALVTSPAWVYAARLHRRTIRNWDAASNPSAGDP
jgi:hypothetical protein